MTIYDVTPEIIKRAKKMKTIQNEFTITPSGRIPGRICEEIFQLMYPMEELNHVTLTKISESLGVGS